MSDPARTRSIDALHARWLRIAARRGQGLREALEMMADRADRDDARCSRRREKEER